MSTNINTQLLKKFIIKQIGLRFDEKEARDLKMLKEYNNAVGQDEADIPIEGILDDEDLYAQFATMYTAEIEKNNEEVDKEKEKEEQNKVNEKNEAKA